MVIAYHKKDTHILNIERGEELLSSLRAFLDKEKIKAGYFTGLGAAEVLELAYYNLSTKKFERHTIREDVEILSLVGNIAILKNERIIHIHGTFGRKDLSVLGGHIFSLHISGACEIHLIKLPGEMTRAYDEATGLNLLCSIPS
ncbi:MAG: DNA-binding protein [bacterium]|nr:DNA-binding protein [bacterium]